MFRAAFAMTSVVLEDEVLSIDDQEQAMRRQRTAAPERAGTAVEKTRLSINLLYYNCIGDTIMLQLCQKERGGIMPVIMPIKELRNTSEISDIAHKMQEPIFITRNGYSDLVVMSSELYDKFARTNRIDQAIFESEKELEEGGTSIDLDDAFEQLDRKYYG